MINLFTALPAEPGPTSRLLVVLHGTERNAADYRDAWHRYAHDHDRVVVCPEFDRHHWPHYVRGGEPGPDGVPPVFAAITALAARTAAWMGLADPRFDVWGHSAGAQVAHRFLLFQPDAPVRRVIAANAGWYTRPGPERWPYGTGGIDPGLVRRFTRGPLVLMRGDRDVERDPVLRVTPRADRQGPHRFARAAAMLASGRAADPDCRWELHDVPGVGHRFAPMADAAHAVLAAPAPVPALA